MTDDMRFAPDSIEVRQDETVRSPNRDEGKTMHDMVIGHGKEREAHAALPARFPGMGPDEPCMAHRAPGTVARRARPCDRVDAFPFTRLIAERHRAGMAGGRQVVR